MLGMAQCHSEFNSPVIDEYDRHGFTTSNYQALYNKSRNEYVVKKQRMFDVAQDFKEAKAAYTAAVNAQLGQTTDNDGNIVNGDCSWFSYTTVNGGCSGGISGTAAIAAIAGGSIAGFAILDKLLKSNFCGACCGGAVGGVVGAAITGGGGGGGGGGFRGGYGGRGYRNYNQTMDVHCIESPILPTQKPKKKKKNKQIWLVCIVIMVLLVIIGVGFALSQDSL